MMSCEGADNMKWALIAKFQGQCLVDFSDLSGSYMQKNTKRPAEHSKFIFINCDTLKVPVSDE
jgi:hypothetical protein